MKEAERVEEVEVDWEGFRRWLLGKGLRRRYVNDMVNYAKRFAPFLGYRMSEMVEVSGWKHGLRALANLAKYLGVYGEFKVMIANLGLKWTEESGEDVFGRIYDNEINGIDEWLEKVRNVLDNELWFAVLFLLETGLRTNEGILALELIRKGNWRNYVNEELGLLEHFRFRDVFFRKTKKVYISVLRWETMEKLRGWRRHVTYEILKNRLEKAGIKVRFYDLRKFYATLLVTNGIEMPTVDFLQGRVGGTVFMASYFRPEIKSIVERVRRILDKEMRKWS